MKTPLPVRCVTPIEEIFAENEQEVELLRSMGVEAETYLRSFTWCQSIKQGYFGAGIGKIVAIFLFGIVPNCPGVEEWIWVVVGDIPSAYLVTDQCKTPSDVLRAYIWEMRRWVELAKKRERSADVIPVNVPPTPYWANQLSGRLRRLENDALPYFEEQEKLRS
jgi:hypothetical protein